MFAEFVTLWNLFCEWLIEVFWLLVFLIWAPIRHIFCPYPLGYDECTVLWQQAVGAIMAVGIIWWLLVMIRSSGEPPMTKKMDPAYIRRFLSD
jgi:hypothetical protein